MSIARSRRVRRPRPRGAADAPATDALTEALSRLRERGPAALGDIRRPVQRHRDEMELLDPDTLDRNAALAFWLNLYNAGALDLAARTAAAGSASVLRVPGGFSETWATVAGESLSLDAIEHGKIRRFGDPRIHGALVCGSASCPTLRHEPYTGDRLDAQLDGQLRSFFASGGAVVSGGDVLLSRILLWYGADFVRPHRMPTFVPASRKAIVRAITRWLPDDATSALGQGAGARFQPYDWSLACSIG